MKPGLDNDSPFAPGFGIAPPYAPGREELTHDTIRRARRGYHTIVVGPRGVGKTVWLNEIGNYVRHELGGQVLTWSAGDPDRPLAQALADQAPRVDRQLTSRFKRALRRVEGGVTVKAAPAGIGAEASTRLTGAREPGTGSVTQHLTRLAELAQRRGRLILLQVDELQSAPAHELITLGAAVQAVANEARLPLVLVAAGLPSTRRAFGLAADHTERAPSTGFLERQNFQWIGNLDHESTIQAIGAPIHHAGWTVDGDALETMAAASCGYPFAIQLIGEHTWEAAERIGHVTIDDAREGVGRAYRRLAEAVYEPRWRAMSDAEQRYTQIAASVRDPNGVASTRDITAASGDSPSRATERQRQLVERHQILEVDDTSNIRFTIPGFADWAATQRLRGPTSGQIRHERSEAVNGRRQLAAAPEPVVAPTRPSIDLD